MKILERSYLVHHSLHTHCSPNSLTSLTSSCLQPMSFRGRIQAGNWIAVLLLLILIVKLVLVVNLISIREEESKITKKERSTPVNHLYLGVQSTNENFTKSCLKTWCSIPDELYIFPKKSAIRMTENSAIKHFSQMFNRSFKMKNPNTEWFVFAFDDNYVFMERLVMELSALDSHLPIYSVIRDTTTNEFHLPIVVMSRFALITFMDSREKSTEFETLETWIKSCLQSEAFNMSTDHENKSRSFALNRHIETDEMKKFRGKYDDGWNHINAHSSKLITFTNLTQEDVLLLPVLIERIHGDFLSPEL